MGQTQGRAAPAAPKLYTVGAMADELSVRVARVEYVVATRNITHVGWAGNARLFDASAFDEVRKALTRIASGTAQWKRGR